MSLFQNKYRIEPARLKGWDYSSAGAYFITICTEDHIHHFGKIVNSDIVYSEIGKIAYLRWRKIAAIYKNIKLEEFVIMPSHVHGIIIIEKKTNSCEDAPPCLRANVGINNDKIKNEHILIENGEVSLHHENQFSNPIPGSIPVMIGLYKSWVTKWCKSHGYEYFKWQPKYWDRVIRDESEYERIRKYIINNPQKWDKDKLK